MKWYFSPQLPGQVEAEVTQRDQFSNDELELSETIVRESIQNSLDAALSPSSVVTVTFKWLNKTDGLAPQFYEAIFDTQLKHAEQAGLDIDHVDFSNPTALIIEDFGTKGLTGSISSKDNDNFSDFWRRHGKSHKTGISRGRWGLGKLVYSCSSLLGTFFGATQRSGDPSIHVMGQTVLNLHSVDGVEYPPHGFFADIEGESLYEQIPVPLKDVEEAKEFVEQFSLERSSRSGLSVIIPFPHPDLNRDHMLGVAIVNYFFPIITGQLILQFGDIEINGSNIRELAHEYASEHMSDINELFDFIEESYHLQDEDLLEMKPSWLNDEKLDENDFDEHSLDTVRENFKNGRLIAIRFPVTVKNKDSSTLDTKFTAFIKKPSELDKGIDLYVRGGLTLPGESKFRERKALGLMLAEHEVICSFLGDAENASHSHWVASAEKLRHNYKNPGKTIKVIKNCLIQLYDLLAEIEDEIDDDALTSFFWMKDFQQNKPKNKAKKTPVINIEAPKAKPKDFHINETADGFSITSASDALADRFPQVIKIEVAYDTIKGNPFKKYSPLDFKLGKNSAIAIAMTSSTAKVLGNKENVIRVEVLDLPFQLKASGFDSNRDLKVRLTKEG